MEIELVPCEHCGGAVTLMAVDGRSHAYEVDLAKVTEQSDDVCFVHCDTCKANWHLERRIDSFPLDTIEAWNRRFTDGTAK